MGELSEKAKKFVKELKERLLAQDPQRIHDLKETRFPDLAQSKDAQFKDPVPHPDKVARELQLPSDDMIILLYKELFHRHMYSTKKPEDIKIEDRKEAWKNYLRIFEWMLDSERGVEIDLPNGWLYDMIDEFVYQLQVYCRYRADRRAAKKPDDVELERIKDIRENPDIWEPITVIQYLQQLTKKSDVVHVLEQIKIGKMMASDLLSPGPKHVSRMIGYFAMVGLLRVHCLMGDYHLALKSVEHIDFTPEREGEKVYKKVQACHITILYYAGFSHMMMRRNYDAVRILHQALKSRSIDAGHSPNQTISNISKMRDHCARILVMALELAGKKHQNVDETLTRLISDRLNNDRKQTLEEDLELMRQGTEDSVAKFKAYFMQSCPKFFLPSAALSSSEFVDAGKNEALNLQLNLFLREVRQQLRLPTLRSYLKLYSTITVDKLVMTARDTSDTVEGGKSEASVSQREKDDLIRELMCLKHKTIQQTWPGSGPPLDSNPKCLTDTDFYLDKDIVHIDSEFRRPLSNASYFVSQIESLRHTQKAVNPADIFRTGHLGM